MFSLLVFPLAFLPSLIWLLFYLRKDVHPEPNRLIIRVFLWSLLITTLVALAIFGIQEAKTLLINRGIDIKSILPPFLALPFIIVLFNAFWEEILKYLVVHFSILKNKHFDEPVDAMEYMIIAALAFAAVENVLISFRYESLIGLGNILFARFLGATFIHALSSAIVGFFLARAIFHKKNRKRFPLAINFVLIGLLIASGLHGIFNFLIIKSENLSNPVYLYLIAVFLVFLSVVVTRAFRRLNIQSLKKN